MTPAASWALMAAALTATAAVLLAPRLLTWLLDRLNSGWTCNGCGKPGRGTPTSDDGSRMLHRDCYDAEQGLRLIAADIAWARRLDDRYRGAFAAADWNAAQYRSDR